MTTLTAEQRGDLADYLLPFAARLACLVHGDGGPRDIEQAIVRLDRAQRDALLVVLAGLVDPDAQLATLLSYLVWDEHGRPVSKTRTSKTIRDLADSRDWPQSGWLCEDVLRWERQQAARLLTRAGETADEVGNRLGVSSRTVERWLAVAS